VIDARNKTLETNIKAEITAAKEEGEMATKADIHDLKAELVKKVKSHDYENHLLYGLCIHERKDSDWKLSLCLIMAYNSRSVVYS